MNTQHIRKIEANIRSSGDYERYRKIAIYTSQIKDYEINGTWGTRKEAIKDCLEFLNAHPRSRYICTITHWNGKATDMLAECFWGTVDRKRVVIYGENYPRSGRYLVKPDGTLKKITMK